MQNSLDAIEVELSVILGSTRLPIRQLLKMSRGAMIAFDAHHDEPSLVTVGGQPIATGRIQLDSERMAIEIVEVLPRGGVL